MKSSTLLSTAFAAVLMASPGLALAQAGGTNEAAQNAKNAASGVAYSHIGQGGHTGDAMPIKLNNGNGNGNGSGSSTATRPSQRNPLLSDNGDVEITQMVGSAVLNEHDQNLGTVNGVLVGNNGVWAVISTHNKKVAVPFKDFVFGNANANGDDKVVLPHYTEAKLNTLPAYQYKATNYTNGNNNG